MTNTTDTTSPIQVDSDSESESLTDEQAEQLNVLVDHLLTEKKISPARFLKYLGLNASWLAVFFLIFVISKVTLESISDELPESTVCDLETDEAGFDVCQSAFDHAAELVKKLIHDETISINHPRFLSFEELDGLCRSFYNSNFTGACLSGATGGATAELTALNLLHRISKLDLRVLLISGFTTFGIMSLPFLIKGIYDCYSSRHPSDSRNSSSSTRSWCAPFTALSSCFSGFWKQKDEDTELQPRTNRNNYQKI